MQKRLKNRIGLGFLEILIALSLILTISVFFISSMQESYRQERFLSSRADRLSVRQTIVDKIDCKKTFESYPLDGGTPPLPICVGAAINLKTTDGGVFVSENDSRFGNLLVRATCTAEGLDIRAASVKPGSPPGSPDYFSHAFDGTVPLEDTRARLFPLGAAPCQEAFAGTAYAPPTPPIGPGTILFFDLPSCPGGWEAVSALEGRYVVGLNAGGTLAGVVGTRLSNLENRPAGSHTHSFYYQGFGSPRVTDDESDYAVYQYTGMGATTSSSGATMSGAPLQSGTNAPYIQFIACRRRCN